jgi:hypothetical protein
MEEKRARLKVLRHEVVDTVREMKRLQDRLERLCKDVSDLVSEVGIEEEYVAA